MLPGAEHYKHFMTSEPGHMPLSLRLGIGVLINLMKQFSTYLASMREISISLHANNIGADQPVHQCSLVRAFVILFMESITYIYRT